jgi:tetratricopeptide (TPR) repeat protein
MAALRDAQGEPVVAANAGAVERLDEAVAAYLGARADATTRAAAAVAADPGCALAHCLEGYLRMLSGRREGVADARRIAERAASLPGLTGREGQHVAALATWAAGDMGGAVRRWDAALADHPRDLLALRISQFVLSYLGESLRMRETVERALPAWDAASPGYGWLLGCHAYALEEAGDYAAAERAGRAAVERNPADIWAAHAVVHVNEMQGRAHTGVDFVASVAGEWGGCGTFANHLRWHEALYRLELEAYDRALAIYDADVRAAPSEEYLDVTNAVSLLWRMEQLEIDVGDRWVELTERARRRLGDHVLVFADVHYAMALAAVGDEVALQQFVEESERFAAARDGTESEVMAEVGLDLIRAAVAHRRRDYGRAVDLLLPVRERVRLIGGSHAQRDLFAQMLIDAAWRGGRLATADALLGERTARRPRNAWGWRHRAAVQEASGSSADESRRQLERLRSE